jgi:dipeptidyl aminopeptidase/acylaminoacyl peptidase
MTRQSKVPKVPAVLLAAVMAVWIAAGQPDHVSGTFAARTTSLCLVPLSTGEAGLLASPDSRHVAFPSMRGGKWCVMLDGVSSKPYSKVAGLKFSPDGKRLAFVATRAPRQELVVVDGQEGKEYGMVDPQSLTFSPDSRCLAFTAGAPDSVQQRVVLDGQEGPEFEMMCGGGPGRVLLFFSPDSKQLAYGAGIKTTNGHAAYSVVVEGAEPKTYQLKEDNAPIVKGFSPDHRQLVWFEDSGKRRQIVTDGKPGKEFDEIGRHFAFSADGKRTAFFAKRAGKWMAVVDGEEGPAFDSLGDSPPTFSPDGRRLAYVANRGEKAFVMLDCRGGREYDGVGLNSLRFSPDNQHFAYLAHEGTRRFAVRDGREGKAYEGLHSALFFSPDSRSLAYAVAQASGSCYVLDDRERKTYDGLANNWYCFSPDSKHLAYAAARGRKLVLVVDEREVAEFQGNLGTLAFDGPNLLRGMVTRMNDKLDWEIARLEVEMPH